jgi:hypothetical protein
MALVHALDPSQYGKKASGSLCKQKKRRSRQVYWWGARAIQLHILVFPQTPSYYGFGRQPAGFHRSKKQ